MERTRDSIRLLHFRLILRTRSPDSVVAARAKRLPVSGKPEQYVDLTRFLGEQEQMGELVSLSKLPLLWINVSDNDVSRTFEGIADWVEEPAGFHGSDFASDPAHTVTVVT